MSIHFPLRQNCFAGRCRAAAFPTVVAIACALLPLAATADDTPPAFIRGFAGAFLSSEREHNYYVESELRTPVLRLAPVTLLYAYREATPFLRNSEGPQAEVLARRQAGEFDLRLNDHVRLIALGGYRSTYRVDTPGRLSAYELGAGLASTAQGNGERLAWAITAGSFLDRRNTGAEAWFDLRASWRVLDLGNPRYLDAAFRPSLALFADMQTVFDNDTVQPFFRTGPALQLLSAYGNRAQLQFLWYHNDDNRFMGQDENGLLFGLQITSAVDPDRLRDVGQRQRGWVPLVWGSYDLGFGDTRRTSHMSMHVELVDFDLGPQPFTAAVWYESRQEYRVGDFDNIGYSVSLGVQTPVGLASPLSQGQSLIAGIDFLHRSDHALNPAPTRIPPGTLLDNGSQDLLPRLRLQTPGWDLPYRDPDMFRRATRWLHAVHWRVTGGYDISRQRESSNLAAQLGLDWDVAAIEGHVFYTKGLVSLGNETPDWLAECGLRRPLGKVFARYEFYGMQRSIARGDTLVLGVGVNL